MALKALIFAGDYQIYSNYIKEYSLNRSECKYVRFEYQLRLHHKDIRPGLPLIFLTGFCLTPVSDSDLFTDFLVKSEGRKYIGGKVAARLIQLTYVTKLEQLPEYLSHEDEEVRMAALKRQEELNGSESTYIRR